MVMRRGNPRATEMNCYSAIRGYPPCPPLGTGCHSRSDLARRDTGARIGYVGQSQLALIGRVFGSQFLS